MDHIINGFMIIKSKLHVFNLMDDSSSIHPHDAAIILLFYSRSLAGSHEWTVMGDNYMDCNGDCTESVVDGGDSKETLINWPINSAHLIKFPTAVHTTYDNQLKSIRTSVRDVIKGGRRCNYRGQPAEGAVGATAAVDGVCLPLLMEMAIKCNRNYPGNYFIALHW